MRMWIDILHYSTLPYITWHDITLQFITLLTWLHTCICIHIYICIIIQYVYILNIIICICVYIYTVCIYIYMDPSLDQELLSLRTSAVEFPHSAARARYQCLERRGGHGGCHPGNTPFNTIKKGIKKSKKGWIASRTRNTSMTWRKSFISSERTWK